MSNHGIINYPDAQAVQKQLDELMTAAYNNDDSMVEIVEKIVPTYSPKRG